MPTPHPDPWTDRVQALLAKAESTPYAEEAEALVAKAQQLMARHAIDAAVLAAGTAGDEIVHDDVVLPPPYASAKADLLNATARANRCRVVLGRGPSGARYGTVIGFASDVADVRTLFAALSLQAVRFMRAAPVPADDTPRRFRHSFLLAFAWRVGQRLRDAERSATAEAQADQFAEPAGRSVSLVLADREAKVDQAVAARFPHLRTRRISSSSAAGHRSGSAAADRASLGGRGVGGGPRALPG